MKISHAGKILLLVVATGIGGYAAVRFIPSLASLLPRSGRVLDFTITKTSDDGPERAPFVEADVSPETGTLDDFAATAVAIASIVPGDKVIVGIERNDVAPSVDRWRRTLARAEFRRANDPPWYVSTVDPLLPANEIAAANEYSARAGLALTKEDELLSPAADKALLTSIAAEHGVPVDRVTMIAPLRHETGERSDWNTRPGPGSAHLDALAQCYAASVKTSGAWKDCR